MNKICIGIISWLPDDTEARKVRISRLNQLLYHCVKMFELPIIIIAQNWKPGEIVIDNSVTIYPYGKLGITGARKVLREKFLESEYDKLLMFDDDFEMYTTVPQVKEFIQICKKFDVVKYKDFLLNGFCVSKEILKEFDYKDVSAENGEGFEDWILVSMIQNKYPVFTVSHLGLAMHARSTMVNDKYSTWLNETIDKDDIDKKTREILKENKCNH